MTDYLTCRATTTSYGGIVRCALPAGHVNPRHTGEHNGQQVFWATGWRSTPSTEPTCGATTILGPADIPYMLRTRTVITCNLPPGHEADDSTHVAEYEGHGVMWQTPTVTSPEPAIPARDSSYASYLDIWQIERLVRSDIENIHAALDSGRLNPSGAWLMLARARETGRFLDASTATRLADHAASDGSPRVDVSVWTVTAAESRATEEAMNAAQPPAPMSVVELQRIVAADDYEAISNWLKGDRLGPHAAWLILHLMPNLREVAPTLLRPLRHAADRLDLRQPHDPAPGTSAHIIAQLNAGRHVADTRPGEGETS